MLIHFGGFARIATFRQSFSLRYDEAWLIAMVCGLLPAAAMFCAATTTAAASQRPAPWAGEVQPRGVAARLLAAHNIERARVGVPPLQWDARLAQAAGSYGPALARLGRLQHSPRESRLGQRENLWMGARGLFSPEQMVGLWLDERKFFRSGIFPFVSTSGNWHHVAHYTQMIWPTTTRVGCAIYSSGRTDYLICRYSPPGNVDGRRV